MWSVSIWIEAILGCCYSRILNGFFSFIHFYEISSYTSDEDDRPNYIGRNECLIELIIMEKNLICLFLSFFYFISLLFRVILHFYFIFITYMDNTRKYGLLKNSWRKIISDSPWGFLPVCAVIWFLFVCDYKRIRKS